MNRDEKQFLRESIASLETHSAAISRYHSLIVKEQRNFHKGVEAAVKLLAYEVQRMEEDRRKSEAMIRGLLAQQQTNTLIGLAKLAYRKIVGK